MILMNIMSIDLIFNEPLRGLIIKEYRHSGMDKSSKYNDKIKSERV